MCFDGFILYCTGDLGNSPSILPWGVCLEVILLDVNLKVYPLVDCSGIAVQSYPVGFECISTLVPGCPISVLFLFRHVIAFRKYGRAPASHGVVFNNFEHFGYISWKGILWPYKY